MKITLKDGSVKEYEAGTSVMEIAKDISGGLARAACAGEVNGRVVDLRTEVSEDCELNILTANDKEGLQTVRHTASHVMAEAVKRLFPEAKLAIGPSIDTGFYYDFEHAPDFFILSARGTNTSSPSSATLSRHCLAISISCPV